LQSLGLSPPQVCGCRADLGLPTVLRLLGPGSENMPFLHHVPSLLKMVVQLPLQAVGLRVSFFCLSLEQLPAAKVKKQHGFLLNHAVAVSGRTAQ